MSDRLGAGATWQELLAAAPVFVKDSEMTTLVADLEARGARTFIVDASTGPSFDVLRALRECGALPDWMGLNWNALWDVFDEVREQWERPTVLVLRGVDQLSCTSPWCAVNATSLLAVFARDMSDVGPPVLPVYSTGCR